MAYDSAGENLVFQSGAHLSVKYFLETTDFVSRWLGRDVVNSLVFLAILSENFRDFAFTPLRTELAPRPVSITALARTLDMPYETVRRHARALSAAGFCRKQKGGYVVSVQVPERLDLEDLLEEMTSATRRLLKGLIQIGAPLPKSACPAALDFARCAGPMAIRFYVEGMVGVCQSLNMDVVRVVILLNIVRRNHSEFEPDLPAAGMAEAPAHWNVEAKRQAVTTYGVAKTLRIPYETVRRHCRALLEQGAVETHPGGGLLVTGRQLGTREGLAATQTAWSATKAFFDSLAQMDQALALPAFS